MMVCLNIFCILKFLVYGASSKTTINFNNEEFLNESTELCVSALAQRRSAQLPKLKELSVGGPSIDCNLAVRKYLSLNFFCS